MPKSKSKPAASKSKPGARKPKAASTPKATSKPKVSQLKKKLKFQALPTLSQWPSSRQKKKNEGSIWKNASAYDKRLTPEEVNKNKAKGRTVRVVVII